MYAQDWLLAPTLRLEVAGIPAVTLEALSVAHAQGLAQYAGAQTVAWLSRGGPVNADAEAWAEHITALNALPNRMNFAVLVNGEVAGRISYSEVKPADRWVEIGTMLTPPFQGGVANPGAKLLLMERAFEVLGAGRVQFKVDERNDRSLRALARLGAVQEGTLRAYQVRPDGQARNSVVLSVLSHEWPPVKAALQARVEKHFIPAPA